MSRQLKIAVEIGYSKSIYWLEIGFQISRVREQGYPADSRCQRLPHGCDSSQASGPWAIGSGYRFTPLLRANPGGGLDNTQAWERVPRTIP